MRLVHCSMLLTITLWAGSAHAADAPTPPMEQARFEALAKRQTTAGVAELAGGGLAIGAGFALMTAGRRPGQISTEAQGASDLRTMSGIGLLLAGATTMIMGGNMLTKAAVSRDRAEKLAVGVRMDPVNEGLSLHFGATF
ncbi:MAG: hypothetical protein KTR31_07540 [Myxococcales bacterium]|nr:hypothetical protein [Myxococcales bacterium]